MFNNSKFTKVYFLIINRALERPSAKGMEKHHIVPKSIGGQDKKFNLAHLTPKEHRLCHLLLTKMVDNPQHKISMYCAAWRMNNRYKVLGLSKGSYYEHIRNQALIINKNKVVSEETKEKIRQKRKLQTNISNQYLSGALTESPRKGKSKDNDSGYKTVSEKLTGRKVTWSDKLSLAARSAPKCSCLKCKQVFTAGSAVSKHFAVCN